MIKSDIDFTNPETFKERYGFDFDINMEDERMPRKTAKTILDEFEGSHKVKIEKAIETKFGLDEFSVQYTIPSGVDRQFEGWLVEQLNDRFPGVSCDLELSTRIRRITFRR